MQQRHFYGNPSGNPSFTSSQPKVPSTHRLRSAEHCRLYFDAEPRRPCSFMHAYRSRANSQTQHTESPLRGAHAWFQVVTILYAQATDADPLQSGVGVEQAIGV